MLNRIKCLICIYMYIYIPFAAADPSFPLLALLRLKFLLKKREQVSSIMLTMCIQQKALLRACLLFHLHTQQSVELKSESTEKNMYPLHRNVTDDDNPATLLLLHGWCDGMVAPADTHFLCGDDDNIVQWWWHSLVALILTQSLAYCVSGLKTTCSL